MNTFRRLQKWTVLMGLTLATVAYAQKEQWLEYHIDREGRGYHWLDLTTNAPAGLALPKLNARPYFARWVSPLDAKGGRWACFDRTRKSGPYDRVYFDSNGNGRLDDKTPITTTRLDQYSAYFEPAKVVFKGEDGPITYHVVFRFMSYPGGDTRLLIASGGYYGGTVEIGGKKRRLELIDGNANGVFNDRSTKPGECDSVAVAGSQQGQRYLGKLLEVDGQFFQIEVARDGAFVKLQKAENVVLGAVRVPESISQFTAFGENGQFTRKPVKGEFTLPAGEYQIEDWVITRKDSKGVNWQVNGSGSDESPKFEATAAKPAVLEVGEPFRMALKAQDLPSQTVAFSLSFKGRGNESLQLLRENQSPPGPRLTLASLDSSYRSTNTFEFG